jgi:fucose 4-O-acetylase-like acetyltransferase
MSSPLLERHPATIKRPGVDANESSSMPRITPSPYRLRWADYSRGISILLVVFAHVRSGLIHSGLFANADTFVTYSRTLTVCAMPLFFFMSGMFVRSALRKPFREFVSEKLSTIAYPYVIWSTIYYVLAAVFAGETYNKLNLGDLWTIVYLPVVGYWFLHALFSMMLIYAVAAKLRMAPAAIFGATVLLYVSQYAWPHALDGTALEALRENLPYFALGAIVNRGRPTQVLSEARPILLLCLVVCGLGVSCFAAVHGWFEQPALKPLGAVPGAIGLMSLAIVLERKTLFRCLPYVGRHSLPIYVAHVLGLTATRVVLHKMLGIDNLWLHFIVGMSGGIASAILLHRLTLATGFTFLYSFRREPRKGTHASEVGSPAELSHSRTA